MAHLAPKFPNIPQPPVWLSDAIAGAQPADLPAQVAAACQTTRHRERWKYTPAQRIVDLLAPLEQKAEDSPCADGVHATVWPNSAAEPPLATLFGSAWQETLEAAPEAIARLCYAPGIQTLHIDGHVSKPIIFDQAGCQWPLFIRLAPNAELDLYEIYTAQDARPQVQTIWIELEAGSRLLHARNAFSGGQHWQFLHVHLGRDATYTLHNHCNGASLRRQDTQIVCAEPGAHANVVSAARVSAGAHLDQQITLEHRAAHTSSQQTFHAIAGEAAKVTFNGRIHIHPGCPSVDARLANKNLSLGQGATINTKPELEIYTDDVKCAHGTTIGSVDADQLFYLASRGVDPTLAQELLSQAFLRQCTTGPLAPQTEHQWYGAVTQQTADA